MIRISISGSHSVGKTVLIKEIFKKLSSKYDVFIIQEVARILIDRGFKMNTEISEFGVLNYALEYLKRERTAKGDIILSDRSIIDLLAYISVNKSPTIRGEYISLIEEIVHLESDRFEYYFYLPIEFPLQIDDVRPADIEYQKKIDEMLVSLFKNYDIKYYSITGSIKERVDKVLSIINDTYK